MSDQTPAIHVAAITKSYDDEPVLRGIDLTVPTGTVYALLGPNGAGKTTMIRVLSTLISADAGSATVAGFDVAAQPDGVRRSIGVTGQFSAVDELLTGRENLRLMADLAHLPGREAGARVDELLDRFGLTEAADRRVATYSGGMKRRLDLAMTLVSRPRLIFLDEPTTGLDPRSRRELWRIVRELLADGVTIFLTTQYLEEADQLADKVGLLDGGRLVAVVVRLGQVAGQREEHVVEGGPAQSDVEHLDALLLEALEHPHQRARALVDAHVEVAAVLVGAQLAAGDLAEHPAGGLALRRVGEHDLDPLAAGL
jgi:ABC-2 type transport system ATP-binding protein